MEPVHLTHLVGVSLWGGLVLGEAVLELSARDEASRRHTARVHFWMDVLVELPLLVLVLATGTWLTAQAWPLGSLRALKVACGLAAVVANLACVGVVVARYRRRDDGDALRRLGLAVRLAGLAAPFALVAAWLGLAYFRA